MIENLQKVAGYLPAPKQPPKSSRREPTSTPFGRIRGLVTAGGLLVGGFILGFGTWSVFAPLESAALAGGQVEVETSRKTIQHLEGGIIGQILVQDGEEVAAGQVLVRLDDTKARATLETLQGQYWDALAREARLLAERDGQPAVVYPDRLLRLRQDPAVGQVVAGQTKIFETRRTVQASKIALVEQRIAQVREEIVGLNAQENAARRQLALIREEISGLRQLVEKGLERKPRLLALERELAEIEGRRGETIAQIARAQQTIAESEIQILNQRNDVQNEVAEQLRETQKKIHELTEQLRAAADVLARTEVRAPEPGVVTDLKIKTPGGVVAAGEPLLDLVPKQDRLIVTARVKPEDIDVVRIGLPAQIRLLSYKQRLTPPIDGQVSYVSADSLHDKKSGETFYAAKITFDERELDKIEGGDLLPGMPADVMIKTGLTTVALYALAPVIDSFNRAFREN